MPRQNRTPKSIYDAPSYAITEAALLLDVPRTTLGAWVNGRTHATKAGPRHVPGVIVPSEQGYLSFTNLVEAFTLAAMRREHRLQLSKIRKAINYVENEMGIERPLARQEFKTDGVSLFVEKLGALINVSSHGQLAMRQVLREHLARIEYKSGMAVRLYPLKRPKQPKSIVIDPKLAYGRPALRGTGIPARMIADRFTAGDSMHALAHDYNVTVELIEEALRAA